MVFKHHSRDIKERAIRLVREGKLSEEEVSELFCVSTRSLQRWLANQWETGDVVRPPVAARGRPRAINSDQMVEVLAAIEEAPAMLLREIQEWIAIHHELHLDLSTIHRNIVDCAYTYKVLRKRASERNEAACHGTRRRAHVSERGGED